MKRFRVDMAFYVEAETWDEVLYEVEDGISAQLVRDYDLVSMEEQ